MPLGAYLAAAIADYGHFTPLFRNLPADGSSVGIVQGWPILLLCLVSGFGAAVIGFVVGLPSLRLRGDYLAIITLGFAQIIQVVIRNTKAVNGFTAFQRRHSARPEYHDSPPDQLSSGSA